MFEIRLATLADYEAMGRGAEAFQAQMGLSAHSDLVWPPEFAEAQLHQLRLRPTWLGVWAIEGTELVGVGEFKSQPIKGEVEIGYAVAPHAQNRGVGTAICRALVAHAFNHGADRVLAYTYWDGEASKALLTRNGFRYKGIYFMTDYGLLHGYVKERSDHAG